MEQYSVAIHHNSDHGYLEYNPETKKVKVFLEDIQKKTAVENYLASKHLINVARDNLLDFIEKEVDPLADVDSLKIALTRMWSAIRVYVDWSRPVDYYRKK